MYLKQPGQVVKSQKVSKERSSSARELSIIRLCLIMILRTMALRPHGHTCFRIPHEICNLSSVVECWYELLNHFCSVRSNVLHDILFSWNIVNGSELSTLRHNRNPEQALLGYLTGEDGGKEDFWKAPGGKRGCWATWETAAWGGNLIRSTKKPHT